MKAQIHHVCCVVKGYQAEMAICGYVSMLVHCWNLRAVTHTLAAEFSMVLSRVEAPLHAQQGGSLGSLDHHGDLISRQSTDAG
jgi:hypothetical protein